MDTSSTDKDSSKDNSPKQTKGMSKTTKIIIGIGAILVALAVLCVIILVLMYFLRSRDGSDSSETVVSSETTETSETTTTASATATTTTTASIPVPNVLTYTHPNYPGFVITYDDTWTLTDRQEDGIDEGAVDLYVELEKGNTTLTYFIGAYILYGGVPSCHLYDEYEIEFVGEGWTRITEGDDGYFYTASAVIKDVDMESGLDFDSVFESWGGMYGEHDLDDYEFCDFDAPIGQETLLEIPPEVYPDEGYYVGGASIGVEFSGDESARLIEQADRIVKGTAFSSID